MMITITCFKLSILSNSSIENIPMLSKRTSERSSECVTYKSDTLIKPNEGTTFEATQHKIDVF